MFCVSTARICCTPSKAPLSNRCLPWKWKNSRWYTNQRQLASGEHASSSSCPTVRDLPTPLARPHSPRRRIPEEKKKEHFLDCITRICRQTRRSCAEQRRIWRKWSGAIFQRPRSRMTQKNRVVLGLRLGLSSSKYRTLLRKVIYTFYLL